VNFIHANLFKNEAKNTQFDPNPAFDLYCNKAGNYGDDQPSRNEHSAACVCENYVFHSCYFDSVPVERFAPAQRLHSLLKKNQPKVTEILNRKERKELKDQN
jgi:hypothetical protein